MNLWFGSIPVFVAATTGAVLLMKLRAKPGLKLLMGINAAVTAGGLALLATALNAGPAAAASGVAAPVAAVRRELAQDALGPKSLDAPWLSSAWPKASRSTA